MTQANTTKTDQPDETPPADGGGTVEQLVTAPTSGAQPVTHTTATIVAGGVAGDRYCRGEGHFQLDGCAVTLAAAAAVAAVRAETGVDLSDGRHRRNIVVRGFGADMDALLAADVRVGEALLRPIRRRPPCAHLASLVGDDDVVGALAGRGGLCCTVREPGRVAVGDSVHLEQAPPEAAGAAIADRLAREHGDE